MTRSIALAALVAAAVAGCARAPAEPPAAAAADSVPLKFVPYCGQTWSVGAQGYLDTPCPAGINYGGSGLGVR
jgi:hypothetical protein